MVQSLTQTTAGATQNCEKRLPISCALNKSEQSARRECRVAKGIKNEEPSAFKATQNSTENHACGERGRIR
jgi:hypothetical protein